MEDKNWVKHVTNILEAQKDSIDPSDFRFYNIAHIPLLAKKTDEYSKECQTCSSNKLVLEGFIQNLPEALSGNKDSRKQFEKQKNAFERHLKKSHHCRFPGYYTAIYSLFGVIIGLFIGGTSSIILSLPPFNKIILVCLATFLIIGRIAGMLIDRRVFVNKLQV